MKTLIIIIALGLTFQFAVLPAITDAGTAAIAEAQADFAADKAAFIDSRVNGE